MSQRQRLTMWLLVAEPLVLQTENKQAAEAFVYLMRALAKRMEA